MGLKLFAATPIFTHFATGDGFPFVIEPNDTAKRKMNDDINK